MTPADQRRLAGELVDLWHDDGIELKLAELLDYLAIAGMKLERLTRTDFDRDGVSVTSHAYFGMIR